MNTSKIYNGILTRFIKTTFPFWQGLGFHVTPNHFYQPVPDTRTLREELWRKESEMVGIEMNDSRQMALLSFFASAYGKEYHAFPYEKTENPQEYYVHNNMFELVDGGILYSMVRHFKPKRIVEIGSGFSTLLTVKAILKNESVDHSYKCEFTAIEPHPSDTLKAGVPGLSRLYPTRLENVPRTLFSQLTAGDILFIDSSHVLKIGSDVQTELLEILPSLEKGVLVHIHDIFLPAEYPKDWVIKAHVFVNEQYVMQAFLTFNDHFEIIWAGHYMRLRHHDKLKEAFGRYETDERWPCSLWIRKTK